MYGVVRRERPPPCGCWVDSRPLSAHLIPHFGEARRSEAAVGSPGLLHGGRFDPNPLTWVGRHPRRVSPLKGPPLTTGGPPPLESVIGGARPGPNPRRTETRPNPPRTECDHASTPP